jgi:acetyltransferase-like isoleucine patch superfamily enzyme
VERSAIIERELNMEDSPWVAPVYDERGITQWAWRVADRENFVLGKNARIGSFTMIDAKYGVTIEENVRVGYGCAIMSYSRIEGKQGKVTLKKGCKIGSHSIIMPGVTIGENAIVGVMSYVHKDVPEGEIWFGTPAEFRGSANQVEGE